MEFGFAIIFNNVNDIMFLIMKLERHTKLNINGNKDENGKSNLESYIESYLAQEPDYDYEPHSSSDESYVDSLDCIFDRF